MLSRVALAFFLWMMIPLIAIAEDCNTDCRRQCGVKLLFVPDFVEPTCHAKCEVAKKAACNGIRVPTVPLTLREQIAVAGAAACTAPFQAVTNAVIAKCSNWPGRTDDQHLIAKAKTVLVSLGILGTTELDGVQVRWCPLQGANGMAADTGRIYLDTALKGNAAQTALTLAHELVHIRQFRAAGSDVFKCGYVTAYADCGGCQDRRNEFERGAYEFVDTHEREIVDAVRGADSAGSSDGVVWGMCVGDGGLKGLRIWGPQGSVCHGVPDWGSFVRATASSNNRVCSCTGHGGVEGVRLWGPEGEACAGIATWGRYSEQCVERQSLEVCACTGRGNILGGHTLWGPRGARCGGMAAVEWGTYSQQCKVPQ